MADLHPSLIKYVVTMVASVPVSYGQRAMPNATARHLYAFLAGAIMCGVAYGAGSYMLVLPIAWTYALLRVVPRAHVGIVSMMLNMSYLVYCHTFTGSAELWREGGIDATGSLMVITLKLIACCYTYQDGGAKDRSVLLESQRERLQEEVPSLLEYLGFCFCNGAVLSGPQIEMRKYLDFSRRKGMWANPMPSCLLALAKCCMGFVACGAFHAAMAAKFSLDIESELHASLSWWQRVGFYYLVGVAMRFKFYFVWLIAEAACIASGLGFEGVDAKTGKVGWGGGRNVIVRNIEFAESAREVVMYWNLNTADWLRHYVYERLAAPGKKPPTWATYVTNLVSGLWHGTHSGYALFFASAAFYTQASKVRFGWLKWTAPGSLANRVGRLLSGILAQAELNYCSMPFILLTWEKSLRVWSDAAWFGHILWTATVLLGFVIPAPKSKRSAKKTQ
jgi:lysophospholipid acyltransferase